jgi:hypothetical protein
LHRDQHYPWHIAAVSKSFKGDRAAYIRRFEDKF